MVFQPSQRGTILTASHRTVRILLEDADGRPGNEGVGHSCGVVGVNYTNFQGL